MSVSLSFQFLFFVVLFIVAEIGIGFYGYAKTADFYEKVHFNIFWAVERYYGNDVINTTLLDFLQQGVSTSIKLFIIK